MNANILSTIWKSALPNLALALALAVFGTAVSAKDSAASGVTPNFQAYCNQNYPNSQFQTDFGQFGPRYSCRRPGATGGFMLQNISATEVCAVQTGSSETHQHKSAGGRPFHCGPDTQTDPLAGPNPDYARYCRENFPNSTVELRQTRWGPRYFCRRPGPTGFGYTLQDIPGGPGGGGGGGGAPNGGSGMNGPRPTAMHLDPCGDGIEGRSAKDVKEFWDDVRDELKDAFEDALDDKKSVVEAAQLAAKDAAEAAMDEGGNRWDAAYAAAAAVRHSNGTLYAAGKAAYDAMIAHGGNRIEATDAAAWAIQKVAQIPTKWQVKDMVRHDRHCSRPYQQVMYNIQMQRQRKHEAKQRRRSAIAAFVIGSVLATRNRHRDRWGHDRERDRYEHRNRD